MVVQFGASQKLPLPHGFASAGLQLRPASGGVSPSSPASTAPLLELLLDPLAPLELLDPLAPLELLDPPLDPPELAPGVPKRSVVLAPLQAAMRKATVEVHATKERRMVQ
jgi:hypothetical protein